MEANSTILLTEHGFNAIADAFNAYNGFVGRNGGSVVHGQDGITFIVGDVDQTSDQSHFIEPIKAGSTDTAFSAERLNQLIRAYNKIMASKGDDACTVHISDGGIVIEVF